MSAVKWLMAEIGQKIDTYEIPDIVIAEALEIEEVRLKEAYREGREFAIINECAKQSTSDASKYAEGYKEGYQRALELVKYKIDHELKSKYELQ